MGFIIYHGREAASSVVTLFCGGSRGYQPVHNLGQLGKAF